MNTMELHKGQQIAMQLAELLKRESLKVVLAESCTCGMAAAMLGSVPGISNYLCGSCVTYRVSTKTNWLGLEQAQIQRDSAESIQTTRCMATGVLNRTPEASWSAAITGDLGPNAGEKDGCIFVCIACKQKSDHLNPPSHANIQVVKEIPVKLISAERVPRQIEAATLLLEQLMAAIAAASD